MSAAEKQKRRSPFDFMREGRFITMGRHLGHKGGVFHPTKFRMVGPYNLWADRSLRVLTSGTTHAIAFHEYEMSTCGMGSSTRPAKMIHVCDELITCRKCIAFVISDFLRDGALKSLCGRRRP